MDEKDKKEYELGVLVATEDALAPVLELVRQHNGEVAGEPRVKKVALAYEIKKHKEAIFAHFNFHAIPADAKDLENALNINAGVIRFLMIASPAPMMVGDRSMGMPMVGGPAQRRTRVMRPAVVGTAGEIKPSAPKTLSNEALEKKIEEILQ